jgi:prolyl-tRNA synthetase
MRQSKLFGKTVRNIPSELKAPSHRLLYQGGFIRRVAAGRYIFLPLGFRVWQKIMDIIEEEMVAVGSQRVNTPNLHPIEIWQATNRDQAFGEEMYIVEDHHGAAFALGATAEGLMVELVKKFKPSYRDLPIYIHQFAHKFRDEKRPRGGILRVREFVMKDAYSFDKSEKDLNITYKKFFDAYIKIAKRFNLKVTPVLAESGAIGGDYNHEFIVKSETGEGEALLCDSCDYAAHIERAESGFKKYSQDRKLKPIKEYLDEEAVTCEVLAANMGIPVHVTTKTILFKSKNKYIAAMVRGDYGINEAKLKRHLNLDSLELSSEEDVKRLTGAEVGFAGPIGLPKGTIVVADITCQDRVNFEVGGNKTGIHLYNVNFGRDLPTPPFTDIREAKEGDGCLECKKGKLKKIAGIEWGHCFKLDQFYSKPHEGNYVDQNGKEKPVWMGSYGIGLGRSMATIVEVHHDEQGIIWPKNVAPFDAHLIGVGGEKLEVEKKVKAVYEKLISKGIDVLWDDRDVSAGEKFVDADLIGIPVRLVISGKLGEKIEWKNRRSKEVGLATLDEVVNRLKEDK